MRTAILAWLSVAVLAGCGGVISQHPASDEATSRADARLIGFWVVDGASAEVGPGGKREEVLAIGRSPDGEGVLRMAYVRIDEEGRLESDEGTLLATTIEERAYASVGGLGEGKTEPDGWGLVRYDVPEDGVIRVYPMDERAVAADVRAGGVAGEVKESRTAEATEPTLEVRLEARTDVLRAWLARRGDDVFAKDRPLVLRRALRR